MDELTYTNIPLLPLRGLTLFPGMLLSFDVERPASMQAIKIAMQNEGLLLLSAQKDFTVDDPTAEDIYAVGTVCRIKQQLRIPNTNLFRVMVEGVLRVKILEIRRDDSCFYAEIAPLFDKKDRMSPEMIEALLRNVVSLYDEYIKAMPETLNQQILNLLANPEPAYVSNYIAQNMMIETGEKQTLLETLQPGKRLELLSDILNSELQIMAIEKEINEKANEQITKQQREYLLHEQLKAIHEELGDYSDLDDMEQFRRTIKELKCSEEIRTKLLKEVARLQKQPFGSSEASVIRNYIEVALELPWGVKDEEILDLKKTAKILDEDHYGLDKVKERILEYVSVRMFTPDIKGGLLCLVGPPGTGKTSIAISIARALNRKMVRVSLGGVHDEAEIRGHRKTYVGAMPGRIVNGLVQAKSMNPVMILDEIDKLGHDYRGDPAAALLEALDPEQNSTFRDNFLEFPVDLSEVLFITTANSMDTIPRPLLDRMEVIELSSYTDLEKVQIAKRHFIPKLRAKHGLKATQLKVTDAALQRIIRDYTRESGVRNLERELAGLCRKTTNAIANETYKSLNLTDKKVPAILGPAKFKDDETRTAPEVGIVRGLAYTSVGGEVLDVEVAVLEGTGKTEVTGNLGDVMKESVRASMTYVRSISSKIGVAADFYKTRDIHIHFPEAAVPKDGPSAGITICMALISALTGIPVNQDVCMTGEISLRGRILPIGGLREKTMAAYRAGMKTVLIPEDNRSDLEKIDPTVRAGLNFVPVRRAEEAFSVVFTEDPFRPAAQD